MTPDNLADITITAQDKADLATHLTAAAAILAKYTIGLPAGQKRDFPTIGPERKAMVADFITSMNAHADLVPGYLDMVQVNKDAAARTDLLAGYETMKEMSGGVEDTLHALGSDLLLAFMAYYSSVQSAAKRNVPGATEVLATVQQHVPRGWKIKKTAPPPA